MPVDYVVPYEGEPIDTGRPLIFVGGYASSNGLYNMIARTYEAAGVLEVHIFPLGDHAFGDIRENAKRLATFVQRVGGDRSVDIVAHSAGGLIARTYLQLLGGTARVAHLVTIGTPHYGVAAIGAAGIALPLPSDVAPIVQPLVQKALPLASGAVLRGTAMARRMTRPHPVARAGVEKALPMVTQLAAAGVATVRSGLDAGASPALKQMLQTSPFMRELNASDLAPGPTQYLSIASKNDGVVPLAHAHLPIADNVANVTLTDSRVTGNHVGIVSVNSAALHATLEFLRR